MGKFKRLSILIAFSFFLWIPLIAGCQKEEKTEVSDEVKESEPNPSINDVNNQEKKTTGKSENTMETRRVTIYFVDDASAKVIGDKFDIHNEYDIWTILQEKGILTEECKLLSLKINEAEKKMELDFNKATGERIRSMGTTGESEIIGCIINTYLDAYSCKQTRLTEEGKSFQTSHGAVFDDYIGRMSFEG